jgi:hypothetical protein
MAARKTTRTTPTRRRRRATPAAPVRRRRAAPRKKGLGDFTGNPLLDAALGGVAAKFLLSLPMVSKQNAITKGAIAGAAAYATATFLKMPNTAGGMAAIAAVDVVTPLLRGVGLGDMNSGARMTDLLVQNNPGLMQNYATSPDQLMDLNVPALSNSYNRM